MMTFPTEAKRQLITTAGIRATTHNLGASSHVLDPGNGASFYHGVGEISDLSQSEEPNLVM